ncbi:MAG: glycerophosphodiester phosphodiesterase family protein, partial [Phycisphaerae bacterium]
MRATEGSWLSAVVVAIGLCVLGLAGLRTAATRARAPAGPAAQQYHRARQVLLGQRDGIVVVAHRGRSRPNAVENSLAALSQAIQDGVPMAEVDVRLTADGVPVLMHDRSLERTVGVGAAVADLTLAQLRQYR